MKKLLLVLLSALLYTGLFSQVQQIKIVSFTVKNQLPAVIDNWNNVPGSLLLIAQIPPGIRINGIRLIVQIKANGAIVCSNNSAGGIQVDNFTTRTFTVSELTGAFTGCHDLKDGNYSLCAQFFNIDRKEISNEVCKEFTVETPKETDFAPPTLIIPDNAKNFTEAELSRPVSFRWTPLVPKPKDPVTYRLKVWQLMQGQNGMQAMRSNQPIVTKDVDNITQAVVNGIYTGPCKPPYLCDFIWQVQAMNKEGKPMGRNNGNSETYSFGVKENEKQAAIKNVFPEDKKQFAPDVAKNPITFRWTPVVPKPQQPVIYRLRVWQLMQGQSGSQAMKTNQPIVTKDVSDITEAAISGIYTGPCRPPYLCDFVWEVQAIDREAHPVGINEGKSEVWVFNIKENNISTIQNISPEDKKQFAPDVAKNPITFRWTPVVPKPQEPVIYRLRVWQLMQGQSGSQAMKTNKPVVSKDVDNITEATVSNIYTGPCRPPYLCDFVWNVQAINRDGNPFGGNNGNSEPYTFSVKENETQTGIKNVFPEDKKQFAPDVAKNPITFRWTPVVPKPQEPVTYRLKVWQLMQGQSGSQAMRVNKPLIEKEFQDILIDMKDQTMKAVINGIYTGPCRPPYLCDFIWNVEAVTRHAGATPQVIATSNPTTFMVTQYIIQLDSIKVNCTATAGVYSFSYTITNPNPGPATLNVFTVTSSVPAGASLGTFSPPINTVINSGNQLTITGTINAAPNLSNICIGAEIKDVGNAFWKASKDTCVNVLPCKCELCDEKHFTFNTPPPQNIVINNNTISFGQPVTITTTPAKTIKTIKAELVYFEMVPENDMCIPCNKDAATYGHFTGGTNSQQWNGPQQNLNINITTPQLTPCCSAIFKWCIRYKIEFTDCTTCNKLVCYEKKKAGCEKTGGGIDNQNNPK